MVSSATEAVWELADHRSNFIEQDPAHAGHAVHTLFVGDFDPRPPKIAERGIEPVEEETYPSGARNALYHDPEGNEIGFGGRRAAG